MKKILQKLRSHRGETLMESLAAILILSLAVTMLAGAVSAAAKINRQAGEASRLVYQAMSDFADRKADHDGTVTVTISGAGSANGTLSFDVSATHPAGPLNSYTAAEDTP
ncbi:MAG: hypothetical protein PHD67_06645 [Oscillospiraceae bacterium]|nr:hypothetical protein [Oscillospiraceae bacterium]